jgi:uncharacterized protein
MYSRWLESLWRNDFAESFVHLIFGARQTGKSTLLRHLLPDASVWLDFSDPATRSEHLSKPGRMVELCRALPDRAGPHVVVVDEAQNVPSVFDSVQHLYDREKKRWRFVLCGSSARKLRVTGANLLPGRSFLHHTYPLTAVERGFPEAGGLNYQVPSPLPLAWPAPPREPLFPPVELLSRLVFGELPGVAALENDAQRRRTLRAYCQVYLSEELRREALIKDWAAFSRFLQLAAVESGRMINYTGIAQEAGLTHPTVKSYFQLLEDMFVGFRVPAFSGSPRKNLLSTDRFFFFDLGVRHAAAELPLESGTVLGDPGPIFEQWVGLELWKRLKYIGEGRLNYFRTKAGAEVDFVLEQRGKLLPIEAKWTENPTVLDSRHLRTFLDEHPKQAKHGWIICRCKAPLALDDRITALPWHCL